MRKHSALPGAEKYNGLKKLYILTRPAKLSELELDELYGDDDDAGWREKSRQLQMRRWRKIRHQLA